MNGNAEEAIKCSMPILAKQSDATRATPTDNSGMPSQNDTDSPDVYPTR
jgi:hypothetical protein